MWSIPHYVDLQIENIRRFAFHVFFLPLAVDHTSVVADEEVRSAFFRTLSSTAPDGFGHKATTYTLCKQHQFSAQLISAR